MICPDCGKEYPGRRCESCAQKRYREAHPGRHIEISRRHYRKKNPLKTCGREGCNELVPNNKYQYCEAHCKASTRERNRRERERRMKDNPIVVKECAHKGQNCERTFKDRLRGQRLYCPTCSKERYNTQTNESKRRKRMSARPDTSPDALAQAARLLAKMPTIKRWSDEPPVSLLEGELPKRVRPNYKQFGVQ